MSHKIILLPYASFSRSVACYSNSTLLQTLSAITQKYRAVKSGRVQRYCDEEMVFMWTNNITAFETIGKICIDEADSRKLTDERIDHGRNRFSDLKIIKPWKKPMWIGWPQLCKQHRGALLQEGEAELLYLRILRYSGLEHAAAWKQENCIETWITTTGFTDIETYNYSHMQRVVRFLAAEAVPELTSEDVNHYIQFNWDERPNGLINAWPPNHERDFLCVNS